MYPDNKVSAENDYTWTNEETGLTWKGNCDGAYKTAAGAFAVVSALFLAI